MEFDETSATAAGGSPPAKAATSAASAVESAASTATKRVGEGFGSPAPPEVSSPLDAKHLDFGGGAAKVGSVPATPATPVLGSKLVPAADIDEALSYNDFIRDTLLWRNKVRSAVYLVGGVLSVLTLHWLLTTTTPLVTGVCYALLAQIALNSVRAAVAPELQERATWSDSAWTAALIEKGAAAVKGASSVHDVHLSGADPTKTLQIAVFLWLLSLVARHVPATALLLAVHLAAFSLPLGYDRFRAKIDQALKQGVGKAKAEFSRLDRRLKAAVILLPTLSLGYLFSRADLLAAIAITVVYARFALKPNEYQKLANGVSKGTGPIAGAASTVGTKLGGIVSSYASKYELTPMATPGRKKTQ